MKQWKILRGENCPECGSDIEVLTDASEVNAFYEDDQARCTLVCGVTGQVSANDDDIAYVNFNNQ